MFYITKKSQVASVAVMNGSKILMGKRKDTGKWTLPGGHHEDGESKHDAAKRELHEESGISVDKKDLKHIGSDSVDTKDGKKRIHAFVVNHNGDKPTSKNDPDKEVDKWKWIETKSGIPKMIKENLHSPKNVVLQKIGLLKSIGRDLVPGGLADKKKIKNFDPKQLAAGKKIEMEHTKNPKIAEEIATDHLTEDPKYYIKLKKIEKSFYITDLLKAGGHKYLRKYMRNGEWIYVYHEGEQHGRQIPKEAIEHLRALAEHHRDPHAKALMDTLQAHDEDKLRDLRNDADNGDDAAHRHLAHLGIDRKAEKAEEGLISDRDPIDQHLGDAKEGARMAIGSAVSKMFDHLRNHTSSPYHTKLVEAGITENSIMSGVMEKDSVRGMLEALHEQLKKVDQAHAGLPQSQNSEARDAGGYGNMVYQKAVKNLEGFTNTEGKNLLPEGYHKVHKRGQELHGVREHEARVERERQERAERERREAAEREERERRELAEIRGSMAHHMSSLLDGRMSTEKIKDLHKTLKNIFGKDMRKEDWPYNFEGHTTKITSISGSGNHVRMDMQVYDASGNPIMAGWTREWFKGDDGRPSINNSYMAIKPEARGGSRIGSQINESQRRLMRSMPQGGTVHVHANIDVGGYNWANQGFSWNSNSSANSFRMRFKNFMAEKGYNLTDSELSLFKDPVHFAAFDDGKKYIYESRTPCQLSELQKSTRSLTGIAGEFPLKDEEIRNGKTMRMAVHLGKLFMLKSDWWGTWDSAKDTDAARFAEAYVQLRDRASKHLSSEYKDVVARVKEGRAGLTREDVAAQNQRPITPRASIPGLNSHVARYVDYWKRGGRPNITMSPRRMRTVMAWNDEHLQNFIDHAPITAAAKRTLRDHLRNRSRS